MDPAALFIAALILLPAVVLVAAAWLAMARVEEELRKLSAFERAHFKTGSQSTENPKGATWPIPG